MKNHDTDAAKFHGDEGCVITAEKPAKARIHVPHLKAVARFKAALVAAFEAGAVLREERNQRGNGFGSWVDTQLCLSHDEADFYIRVYQQPGARPEQLSPAVDVKLQQVLGLLGQLTTAYGNGTALVHPSGATKRAGHSQPKPTVSTDVSSTPTQQAAEPNGVTEQPAKANPVQQDRGHGQLALTADQQRFLLRRSPRLFVQVRKGELPAEEALRLAKDLPDRLSPQRTKSRCGTATGRLPTNVLDTLDSERTGQK